MGESRIDRPGAASGSGFALTDHTADVGIRAWGPDASSLFAAAARGLMSVIVDPDSVRSVTERAIALEAASLPELLHDWLEAVNALHQIEREVFGRFTVEVRGGRLNAAVAGEAIDPRRHDLRTEVKAVTWHALRVRETGAGLEAEVLLDI